MAANVPPLGLSNRAIASESSYSSTAILVLIYSLAPADAEAIGPESNDPFAAVLLPINFNVAAHPPFEEQLLGSTLWPEVSPFHPKLTITQSNS